jgi:beta-lactamase class A
LKTLYKIALASALSSSPLLAVPVNAAPPAVTKKSTITSLDSRIGQLVDVLKGTMPAKDYFDETFLNAVPETQIKAITDGVIKQYGQPLRVLKIDRKSPESAVVTVEFEKAISTININVAATTPYKVNGLRLASFAAKDDSMSKIDAEFAALPGKAGFIVERLNDTGTGQIIASRNAGAQFAIGSTFKLYILAELASQIDARERSWSDVVPLSHRSFSSSATSKWPKDSPATLQTLALQMISVSDNSATDTLLHALGRSAVERKLALVGHSAPDKTLPFLTTVEAFAMKSPANADLRAKFLKASEAEQRKIIETQQSRLGLAQVDERAFANGPAFIDSLEWFASPADIANLMNHIRKSRSDRMLQIMAVNAGIPDADAAKWSYVGYKGGSEAGVISMSFLLQSKSGTWYAVSGSWNNPAKEVDQGTFVALMTRLVQSVQ